MSLPIIKWDLVPLNDTSVVLLLDLIDLVPVPDTILLEFDVLGLVKLFWELQSYEATELSIYEKRIYQNYMWGPHQWSLLDAVPAPDTILQEFVSFDRPEIPMYPAATEINPGTTLFAGDFFSYMG